MPAIKRHTARKFFWRAAVCCSALLFFTSIFFYVRSFKRYEYVEYNASKDVKLIRSVELASTAGSVVFVDHLLRRDLFGVQMGWHYNSYGGIGFSAFADHYGFSWTIGGGTTQFAIPHWFLGLITSILPALAIQNALKQQRSRRLGRCPTCGYDLRATPSRCPECGQPAASVATHPN